IAKNAGDGLTQLAEIQLSNGVDVPPPPPSDMKSFTSKGPSSAYAAKTNVGWTGLKAFSYSGTHLTEGRAYSYNKIFDVDIPVTEDTELSYYIFPEFTDKDHLDYASTYAAVDLAFSDGTYLHELDAVDQHGVKLNPQDQGNSKTLYAHQWNFKKSKIGDVAAGKTIERILIAYDNPKGPAVFKGSIDDIKIEANPDEKTYDRLSDYVNTLRGTQSNGTFSRGNTFPAVAVPHGFNFWTPVTNAGSNWIYAYHESNNEDNLPEIQAFALSHETSPWMGDRQTFQVMPSDATGKPSADRKERALPFKHDNEMAKAHYYSVTFENGIQTEMTPTDHAAMMRFTFKGNSSNLIFDNVSNNGGITLDPDNRTITGYTDQRSGLSTGATRMFIYATFDQPIVDSGRLTGEGRDNVTAYYKFDTTENKVVTMKIATSLISVEQAKKNLEQEIGAEDTFETIKERAQKAWDDKLGIIEVEGATEDQLVTLYSNMYRLFLYPNSAYENVGTLEEPVYKYASQFDLNPCTTSTATETCAKIEDGKVYVNNGFWDTYRTAWPAYALLTPTQAGEMIDGFVQHYRDSGWISRWSSPGYANLMVGTSANIAFADAYLKGVTNFDVKSFYQSAIKDAAVVPPNANVGRKGMATSVFDGYTNTSTGEGLSWALDGYINDFGIANLAKALAEKGDQTDPYDPYYEEDYTYFLNRAQNYIQMFNPKIGFFNGRTASGAWRSTPENFNPAEWGRDYTETNAWNMAFHAPQDGQGLANLYGGKEGLAKKLDEFFETPETAM
ncbi:MAG: GH92 family glycosyl hydrolase, partial [Novibacillus thermophilus]